MSFADEIEVPIACPNCGHEMAKSLRWLQSNRQFACPRCPATFNVTDGELDQIVARLDLHAERMKP